ncbi:MAG: glycerophosphodiester phosphodiesterase family protein [Bacteroidota bacterium]
MRRPTLLRKKIGRVLLITLALLMCFLLVQYFWTGSPPEEPAFPPTLLAHRGVHANYQKGVYDVKTGCEAGHIFSPKHAYIENSLPAIRAAFRFGADIVEIDLRHSQDSQLMVFHDYALDCRTDGQGMVKHLPMDSLQRLDIGYGYTPDSGQSFPFRAQGRGMMPSLAQVLEAFPDQQFLLDHKDWNRASLKMLDNLLDSIPATVRPKLFLWSSSVFQDTFQKWHPEVRPLFLTRKEIKQHFLPFFLSFGALKVPARLEGRAMVIPTAYLPYVWGWPYRFIEAVHEQGLQLYLWVDDVAELPSLEGLPIDGMVTDYIEDIGPAFP